MHYTKYSSFYYQTYPYKQVFLNLSLLKSGADERLELRVEASFVWGVRRQDLSDSRQQRLLRVWGRPGQIEAETLRKFSSRSRVVLPALLHVVELEDDAPSVGGSGSGPVSRIPGRHASHERHQRGARAGLKKRRWLRFPGKKTARTKIYSFGGNDKRNVW